MRRSVLLVVATVLVVAMAPATVGAASRPTTQPRSVCSEVVKAAGHLSDLEDQPSTAGKTALRKLVNSYKRLEKNAPGGVKGAITTIRHYVEKLLRVDRSDPKELAELFTAKFTRDIGKASRRLGRYIANQCKTSVTSADDAGTTDGSGNGSVACPLTAEQVGGVLGAEVTVDEASCTFFPADDALLPNANYVNQVKFACDDEIRSETGYEESVEGVGAEAYVQPGTAIGTLLLVCADGSPFEITVDSEAGDDAELAAATDLARLVLSRR